MATRYLISALALATITTYASPSNNKNYDSLHSTTSAEDRCKALADLKLPGTTVFVSRLYPAGTNFTENQNDLSWPQPVPGLPEFCRFGAQTVTSNISQLQFEVWLPVEKWNGNFIMAGNGGSIGGVNYPNMGLLMSKYGFAASSTNQGHNSTPYDGSYAFNNYESQKDFSYRAVELTASFSKDVIKAFYSEDPKYSYWTGCSGGGRSALKEIQINPDTFDGALIAAPAYHWSHLFALLYWAGGIRNAIGSPGYINATDMAMIGKVVTAQCDEIDGVKDGVITDPTKCFPDLSSLSDRLSSAQLDVMSGFWSNYSTSNPVPFKDFPSGYFNYEKGSESIDLPIAVTRGPLTFAADYFQYSIVKPDTLGNYSFDATELTRLLRIADQEDPAQYNAIDPNLAPFFNRGGKILSYHGWGDGAIPPRASLWYKDRVAEAVPDVKLDDHYRLFMVPGLGHCGGGPGAVAFGGVNQLSDGSRIGVPNPNVEASDSEHDMILALREWTEKGIAPEHIVGTRYINSSKALGIDFQRKFCVWPKQAKYVGGDETKHESFQCE